VFGGSTRQNNFVSCLRLSVFRYSKVKDGIKVNVMPLEFIEVSADKKK